MGFSYDVKSTYSKKWKITCPTSWLSDQSAWQLKDGKLRPLLNGEICKNSPSNDFENRMNQIWSIFKHF